MEYLIKNNYVINNLFDNDFLIIIYYISINKCKIIIHLLNNNSWDKDLKIKIMDINNENYENISLGSCNKNHKIIEYYLNIDIYKIEYKENIIPKNIIQIGLNDYNIILQDLNPDYIYKYFTESDCRNFIKNNQDKVNIDILSAYDIFISNFKIDIFKYLYLYLNGGCFFNNIILKESLNKLINDNDKFIVYDQDIIFVEKYNEFLLECLKDSIEKINSLKKYDDHYFITRNRFNFDINKSIDNNLIIKFNENTLIENNFYYHKKILNYIFYFENDIDILYIGNDLYELDINEDKKIKIRILYYPTNDLFYLNVSKKFILDDNYLYSYNIKLLDYTFYFYKSDYNDIFDILNIKDNIFQIKRMDQNSGWSQDLKIKIIDKNYVYDINIGSSENNKKKFIIE